MSTSHHLWHSSNVAIKQCQFINTHICWYATFCLFSTMAYSPASLPSFPVTPPIHLSHFSLGFLEALNSPQHRLLVFLTAGTLNSSQFGHHGDDVFIVNEGFLLEKKTVCVFPVTLRQLSCCIVLYYITSCKFFTVYNKIV